MKKTYPYKRGDCVVDDNGEIGFVLYEMTAAEWSPEGELVSWHTQIRYRWDQSSYGETRRVSREEIEPYTPAPAGQEKLK